MLSSKRVVLFLSLRALNKARDNLYHDYFVRAILKIMVFFYSVFKFSGKSKEITLLDHVAVPTFFHSPAKFLCSWS